MRFIVIAALALLVPWAAAPAGAGTKPEAAVVASILPVHSLVAGVMEGAGKPYLLVPGGMSPHSFALRPSDARRLEAAQAVFWIGPAMETFLERSLKALAQDAEVVSLAGAEDVKLLRLREGGPWAAHDHDSGAAKDGHRDAAKHEDEHRNNEHAGEGDRSHSRDHGDNQGNVDYAIDAHVWLDPLNAVAFVEAIAHALGQVDPANRAIYEANAERVADKLRALDAELQRKLAAARGTPYIVFHDAYQYFEARYGLRPAGSITGSPEMSPGARRLVEIRDRIRSANAVCVFAEPQFEPKLVRTVIQGTGARTATLDPLGARLKPGPNAYFQLMRNLAQDLSTCLGRRS